MPVKSKTVEPKSDAGVSLEEVDERPVHKRNRAENAAAANAIAAAVNTLANGESRPYRISGDGVAAFLGQLRRAAAERNMRIRSAPSVQLEGAIIWQLIDSPPVKRNRAKKAEA